MCFFFVGGGGFVDLFIFFFIQHGETRFKFLYILTNIKMKNIENYNNHNNKKTNENVIMRSELIVAEK